MIRILIADDYSIVRRGIRQILTDGIDQPFIEEADDTISLINKALAEEWDIIISDISMPGGGGIEAIRQIRLHKPSQALLIVSIYPEEQFAFKVLGMGAYGYVNKDAATDELLSAVKTILAGRRYIQQHIAKDYSLRLQEEAGLLPHEFLNENEYEVMLKLVHGRSVKNIAIELATGEDSVTATLADILQKMDMKNNDEMMKYAAENGLVPSNDTL